MPIFESIGEVLGQIFFESVLYSGPVKIYEWLTGKEPKISGYRTEQKKFIKFNVANKLLLTWGQDIDHLEDKLTDALETMNEKLKVNDFHFTPLDDKVIIHPPTSISFYSFHFLVQWLAEYKIKTLGVVETARTVYTVYNDPNSENLIGRTDKGKQFFISLMEDYSKRQFLRINHSIETIDAFDVLRIKSEIAQSR